MSTPTESNSKKPVQPFTQDCFSGAVGLARYIVKSYSDFINKNTPGEFGVCDESLLPHPKKMIIAAYKLWLLYSANDDDVERCRVQFPLLSQYQLGVGKKIRDFKEEGKDFPEGTGFETQSMAGESLPKVSQDIQLVAKIIDERDELKKIIDAHVQL